MRHIIIAWYADPDLAFDTGGREGSSSLTHKKATDRPGNLWHTARGIDELDLYSWRQDILDALKKEPTYSAKREALDSWAESEI